MIDRKRLLATFNDLIRIDSPSLRERHAADYVKKIFRGKAEVVEDSAGQNISGNCGNLILNFPGNVLRAPATIFLSHLDTVSSTKGIRPRLKKGVISTDGNTILGADDKAGAVAMIELGRTLADRSVYFPRGDVQLVFTVAEEIGLKGSINLDFNLIKNGLTFVLDSTSEPVGAVVARAPSLRKLHINVVGKAAHSGIEPEKGVNAVTIAAEALSRINAGRIDSETTVNFGKINGGLATNIVPDRVVVEGEVRSLKDEKIRARIAGIKKEFSRAARTFSGKITIKEEKEFTAFDLRKDPIIEIIRKAGKKLGLPFSVISSCGGSDANVFNLKGRKAAVLCLGINNPHSTRESIKVENLYRTACLILEIVKGVPLSSILSHKGRGSGSYKVSSLPLEGGGCGWG